jgi:hypothetical protein
MALRLHPIPVRVIAPAVAMPFDVDRDSQIADIDVMRSRARHDGRGGASGEPPFRPNEDAAVKASLGNQWPVSNDGWNVQATTLPRPTGA